MSYKIYKKNNQVFIDNTDNGNSFSGVIGISTINKKPKNGGNSNSFVFMDFPNFRVKEIALDEILKENGSAYTAIEWEEFYTTLSANATPLPISPRPNTTGSNGTTPYKLISLATTNANVVKASGGNLYSIVAIGLTSTVRYLKLYNKATAPTVGTDVPLMTIPIPANTQGAGIAIPFSMGVNFPLGIALAITSGLADNNTGAILANDVVVNLTYA